MPFFLRVLGPPDLHTPEGEVLDFPVGKPLALLSYLVVEGRPVSREDLAQLLWPGSTPDRARHSVRQAIWLLRRKLGEDVLGGEDPVVASGEILTSDLQSFREALAAKEVDAARRLWRGPFLFRLTLPDCKDWEHWREEHREILRLRFFRALVEHARVLTQEGRWEEALGHLEECLRLNPYSMEAVTLQVETLVALGRVPAARQAVEEARRVQADSAAEEEGFATLAATLRDRGPALRSDAQERMGESLEFVGRAGEMAELGALWKSAREGRPRSACILGPTGIGKTRLADEFLSGVEASGGRVARAKGYRSEHRIPRGTVTDLVRQLLVLPGAKGISTGSEAVLRAVLPSLLLKGNGHDNGNGEGNEVGEVQPAALADAVADLVEAVGFEVPLALFIDDWQWADKESRALVGKVMRRVRGLPCLFLLAERTGERRLRQERAEAVIRDLGGAHVVLGSLSESELAELLGLLAVFTDPEGGEELVRRIHRVTGGNPLFVGELLRKLGEEGVYRREGDHWILAVEEVPEELDLPISVQELIRERLERLTPTAASVASALAGERRSAPARVLRRRAGLDEAPFTRAVGELVDREVVGWVNARDLDFAHDQLREAAALFFQPSGRRRLTRWIEGRPGWAGAGFLAAAAAGILAFSGISKVIDAGPAYTYPFGEGSLFLVGTRSAMELRAPGREGEEWTLRDPVPLPRTRYRSSVVDAFRTPEGGLRWFGNTMPDSASPYAIEMLGAGEERIVLRTDGDEGFKDVSSCGGEVLVVSENPTTETYDHDLLVVNLDDGSSRRIYRARERIDFAEWSPDGQRIAVGLRAEHDTLALLSPAGDVLGKVAFPEYRAVPRAYWCTDSRTLLLHVDSGEELGGLLIDTYDGSRREITSEFLPNAGPICLGPGLAAVGVVAQGTGPSFRLFDLVSGESSEIPDIPISHTVRVVWVPDHPAPPVSRIRIIHSVHLLPWGTRDTLRTEGIRADGSTEPVETAWASSDPSVLSVQSGGILSANRAGRAWITATYRDWLRDSIEVRVEDSGLSGQDVLFRADFSDPDLPDWEVYADPLPSVLEHNGDWVLSLNGDGQYRDGLLTRSTFSLGQGATLEAEFRLPLRRTDRQHVHVCLSEEDPGSIDSTGIPVSRPTEFCLSYPSHEQLKFRADLARVVASHLSPPQEFSVAPALPSDGWVHVALQVRADGTTSVFLNRQLAFKPAGRLNLESEGNWSIQIYGASVDTDLWIRNLTLWRGERFDANALPPPASELQGVSPVGEFGDPKPGGSP